MVDQNKSGKFLIKLFPRKMKRLKKATAVEALTIVLEILQKAEMEVKRRDIHNATKSILGARAVIDTMITKCEVTSPKKEGKS